MLNYYNQHQFSFRVIEESDDILEGFFEWTEEIKKEFMRIDGLIEAEDEFWYLDKNGDRLEDELLFQKSPWAIVHPESEQKIVQRMMKGSTGESRFAKQPWFRIGDIV